MNKTKVVFCWSDISGYMAACWRQLQQKNNGIEVFILAFQANTETNFTDQLMRGIPHYLLDKDDREDAQLIEQRVVEQKPDVIVLCGWLHQPYKDLTHVRFSQKPKFIMGMDTPWWGKFKQRVAPYYLKSYINKIDHIITSGERSWQYAIRLKNDRSKVSKGQYGIDYAFFSKIYDARKQNDWPKSFLFVGRYAEVKSVDVLLSAYRQYRKNCNDTPWPLVCCGKGPLENMINQEEGVINKGFVQPDEMFDIWEKASCLVLPSRFDPWPLVVVEACAAGLPVICSDVCGTSVELVRNAYNGYVIPSENVEALTNNMLEIHKQHDQLICWGERSQQLAKPFSADQWAVNWESLLQSLILSN